MKRNELKDLVKECLNEMNLNEASDLHDAMKNLNISATIYLNGSADKITKLFPRARKSTAAGSNFVIDYKDNLLLFTTEFAKTLKSKNIKVSVIDNIIIKRKY